MIGGRVFDTSALEHFATGRSIYARAAVEQSNVLVGPTTALTAAWAGILPEAHPVLQVLLGTSLLGPACLGRLAWAGEAGKIESSVRVLGQVMPRVRLFG